MTDYPRTLSPFDKSAAAASIERMAGFLKQYNAEAKIFWRKAGPLTSRVAGIEELDHVEDCTVKKLLDIAEALQAEADAESMAKQRGVDRRPLLVSTDDRTSDCVPPDSAWQPDDMRADKETTA